MLCIIPTTTAAATLLCYSVGHQSMFCWSGLFGLVLCFRLRSCGWISCGILDVMLYFMPLLRNCMVAFVSACMHLYAHIYLS